MKGDVMTSEKVPLLEGWYNIHLYGRCRIEAVTGRDVCIRYLRTVGVNECEESLVVLCADAFIRNAEFLPWCTSWESVEPKPQEWFDLTSMAGHKLRAEIDEVLNPNNVWIPINASRGMTVGRIKETTHYTHFRCKIEHAPKAVTPPVESPDDWVTQDRVPIRSCDQWRFTHWTPDVWSNGGNDKPLSVSVATHGVRLPGHGNSTLELRCKRKDLPPIEPKPSPQMQTFHEVIRDVHDDSDRWGNWQLVCVTHPKPTDIRTGRTETREVAK